MRERPPPPAPPPSCGAAARARASHETGWGRLRGDPTRAQRVTGAALLLLLLGSALPVVLRADGRQNLYVLQATAFLRGRLDVQTNDAFAPVDVSVLNGRTYVAFPPAPAALLVPLVAVLGEKATNTPLLALALTLVSVLALAGILRRLAVPARLHPWITGGFLLGTGYWYCLLRSDDVWFFAQVVGTTFQLLSIREALGRRRGWLAGLYLGIAFLSRQFAIVTALFVAFALLEEDLGEKRPIARWAPKVAGMGASLAACAAVILILNRLRFGSPLDTGYAYMPLVEHFRARARFGWFSGAYVPFNLVYLLLQGFHVEFESADKLTNMVRDPFGTGVLVASPFVLVAAWADHRRRLVRAAWVAVALTAALQLPYLSNGWVQTNTQRYTLDLWPVLTVPIALGLARRAEDGEERLWLGATLFAVGLNAFAMGLPFLNPLLDWYVRQFRG